MLTVEQIRECQNLLGVSPQKIHDSLRQAASQEDADGRLKELKDSARKAFRQLSKELHPDVTPDPEKHEKFKRLALVLEDLETLNVRYRPPMPPPRPVPVRVCFVQFVVRSPGSNWASATTSTSTSTTDFPGFYR